MTDSPSKSLAWAPLALILLLLGLVAWHFFSSGAAGTPSLNPVATNVTTEVHYSSGTFKDVALGTTAVVPKGWQWVKSNDVVYFATDHRYLDIYSGRSPQTQFPAQGFKAWLGIDDNVISPTTPEHDALKTEGGRDALPLVKEEYLTINGLPSYRALRQLKAGDPAPGGTYEGVTRTDVEYSYLHGLVLYHWFFEIDSNSPKATIDTFDQAAKTFIALDGIAPPGWTEYTNTEYNFRLALPPQWAGYKVTTTKDQQFYDFNGNKTHADVINFEYPKLVSNKGNKGQVGFYIAIYKDPSAPFASQSLVGILSNVRYGFDLGNGAAPDDMDIAARFMPAIKDTFALLNATNNQYYSTSLGIAFLYPSSFNVVDNAAATDPFFTLTLADAAQPSIGAMTMSNRPSGFETDRVLKQDTAIIGSKRVRSLLTQGRNGSQEMRRYLFSPLNDNNPYAEYWITFPVSANGTNPTYDAVVRSIQLLK